MLAFTLRTIIADLRRTYPGLKIILYMGVLGLIVMIPFYIGPISIFYYMVYMIFFSLIPQVTKIFYILPLGNKLLRRYIHLRTFILASFFLIVGGVISIVSHVYYVENIERGWLTIVFYIQLCFLVGFINTIRTAKGNILVIITVGVLLLGNAINMLVSFGFDIQLYIGIGSIIIFEVLLITRLGKMQLSNYEEPLYVFFGRVKEGKRMGLKKLEKGKMR